MSVSRSAMKKMVSLVSNTKRLVGAALLRKRTLCLGGVTSGFPSSLPNLSSAFASATPYPTNMFIIAHGEREGLWHGARLEMYGSLVQLIRSRYFDIPASNLSQSHHNSNNNNKLVCNYNDYEYKMSILDAITFQLNKTHDLFDKMDNGMMSVASVNSVLAENDRYNIDNKSDVVHNNNSTTNNNNKIRKDELHESNVEDVEQAPEIKWRLIWTAFQHASTTLETPFPQNQEEISKSSNNVSNNNNNLVTVNWDEEIIAQWFRSSHVELDLSFKPAESECTSIDNSEPEHCTNDNKMNCDVHLLNDVYNENDLLMENSICFAEPTQAGLRVMRAARLAFLARLETAIASYKHSSMDSTLTDHTDPTLTSYNARSNISYSNPSESIGAAPVHLHSESNYVSRHQLRINDDRSGVEDYSRPLAILDFSEVDSSCSQTAMQCVTEAGLVSEQQCQLTFVPLSLQATCHLSKEMKTTLRIVMPNAHKLHENPFDCLPLYSCDVAAYTSYIELAIPRLFNNQQQDNGKSSHYSASSNVSTSKSYFSYNSTNNSYSSKTFEFSDPMSIRIRRKDASSRLAMALMTLRRGAAVLITFIPTSQSVMAYCTVMESRTQYLEVSREAQLIKDAKRIVAMAISKSGRWCCITDEILPAVDAPQGSAFSLMVIML